MSKKKRTRTGRTAATSSPPAVSSFAISPRTLEICGLVSLAFLLVLFLSFSWRKWPDPLIDFGRELYLPWRISQGAVLYRDLAGHFGPLSQYFNALLFTCFGPGLMVLVTANLILFCGIVILVYLLSRRGWGPMAAFSAVAVFISVFGFSQLTGISNYNYATPYAHETTHGMLVSLVLVFLLAKWVHQPTVRLSFGAGLSYGCCLVLKPEFILAGALVGLAALAIRWRDASFPNANLLGSALLGAVLPTFAFAACFATIASPLDAISWATHAWLRFAAPSRQATTAGIQAGFSGTEQATRHLAEHAVAVGVALALIGSLILAGWFLRKISSTWLAILSTLFISVGLIWLSWSKLKWIEAGRCLLGLLLVYLLAQSWFLLRRKAANEDLKKDATRLLFAILAAALMARMILNGRVYHYGFVQAALAGSIIPAILVGELPEWLRFRGRERVLVRVLIAALIIPGIFVIAGASRNLLRAKTSPVGEGSDRFYAFSRGMEPTGEIVNAIATTLNKQPRKDGLLVLPEGIMLNYLTRTSSTVPYYFFRSTSPELVTELEARPPARVVVISRDLREYGVERYGDNPGGGQEVLAWLAQHYRQVARVGGNPLDNKQRGAILFERKAAP